MAPKTKSDQAPTFDGGTGYKPLKMIHEVFVEVANAKTTEDKIAVLRKNDSKPLQSILQGAYDTDIVWELPRTDNVPYNKNLNPPALVAQNIHHVTSQFFKFTNAGIMFQKIAPGYTQTKREIDFIRMLEAIPGPDADILIAVTRKNLVPVCAGLTVEVVKAAFPSLIPSPGWLAAEVARLTAMGRLSKDARMRINNPMQDVDNAMLRGFNPNSAI